MPSAKFNQFADLLAAGTLRWQADQIMGVLLTDYTFVASHQTLADVTTSVTPFRAPVMQRWVAPGGKLMGLGVVFQAIPADTYQMVLVQDLGNGNPKLLSYYDENADGDDLVLENQGSLIVRPGVLEDLPEGAPADTRLWIAI